MEHETWVYVTPTTEFIRSQSQPPGTETKIRFMKGDQFLGEIYRINIWKSGKTFEQYCTNFMKKSHPLVENWELVLWVEILVPGGGTQQGRGGGDKEVMEYVDQVLKFLETKPEAVAYRNLYRERTDIGRAVVQRIDKELRKRVAPQISSPAKEPGNPFG